jgi:hypothetical protein
LVGAGVSYASGLPLWDDLIVKFIDYCKRLQDLLPPEKNYQSLLDSSVLEKGRHPERVASVLKDQLARVEKETGAKIQENFADWLIDQLSGKPNDNHHILIRTNYPFILTANYDTLLETAARESGYDLLALYSYTFNDPARIAAAIYESKPAIIHIHGSMKNIGIGDFVFTAEDYSRIKRQHPGFAMALDTIFIKYSTLFVGYGGSDPHLEDIAEGFAFKLKDGWPTLDGLPRSFLVLHKAKVNEVLDRYKGRLRTDIVELDDYEELGTLLRAIQKAAPRPFLTRGTNGGPIDETKPGHKNHQRVEKTNLSGIKADESLRTGKKGKQDILKGRGRRSK